MAFNIHAVITEEEQFMIVNALQFFMESFDPAIREEAKEHLHEWEDVAKDTHLPSMDKLATKIATLT
jgi:hypothetical protein